MNITNELENIKIFQSLSIKEIDNLFNNIKFNIKTCNKNDVVFFREDTLDGMYIVLDGILSAEMLKDNGDIYKIENLYKGDIIASAFIFGKNNNIPVDLVALKTSKILHIDKENLLKLFKLNQRILINYLNEISDKTQFLSNKIWKIFTTKTIKEKVLDYIYQNKDGDIVIFKHSIKELSEIFAVSRPSLSRVISEFVEEGVLKRDGKHRYKIFLKRLSEVCNKIK